MKRSFLHGGLFLALAASAFALPTGVWIREKNDDCCAVLLEITSDGDVFCMENWEFLTAKAEEAGENLRVELRGETRWVFTKDGPGWIDQNQRRWVPRDSLVKIDPAWTDVTIHVKDQHGAVLQEAGIDYRIESPSGLWDPMLARPLETKTGTFVLKAPAECDITLTLAHPDVENGFAFQQEISRKNDAKELTAEFERGRTTGGADDEVEARPEEKKEPESSTTPPHLPD